MVYSFSWFVYIFIPLIKINDKYTNKLINEIPSIKSDIIRHIKGIAKPIYLFLKLIIENKATAVIGVKFGGWGISLEKIAITIIPITKYSLFFFIFLCN